MKRSDARNEGVASGASTWTLVAPRRRRLHRGPLALASLVFLFVLGLGQLTMVAGAGEPKTEPVATETTEAPQADAPSEEAAATEEDSTEADSTDPAGSADPADPADSPDSEGSEGSEEPSDSTEPTDAEGEADATADSDAEVSSEDDATEDDAAVKDSKDESSRDAGAEIVTTLADTPGPASGSGEQPILVPGNPSCATEMPGAFLFEVKREPVQDETVPLTFTLDDGTVLTGTLVIDVNESAQTVSFTLTGDFEALGVIVKGGPNANFYDYRPGGTTSDTGLHAPVNPNNQQFYGLSHLSFCLVEVEEQVVTTDIDVEKSCPGTVEAGEPIEYMITVTNTGTETLVNITVVDTLLGDITDAFDPDLSVGLAAGASATAVVTYQPGAGEDPVENTVTATGTGEESEDTVSDSDSCVTNVNQPPPPPPDVSGGGGENPPPGVGQAPPVGSVSGGTAFTGSDTWIWAAVAAVLALFGLALIVATRKGHA